MNLYINNMKWIFFPFLVGIGIIISMVYFLLLALWEFSFDKADDIYMQTMDISFSRFFTKLYPTIFKL